MEVLEKAAEAVGGIAGNALEAVKGLRQVRVFVSNFTDVPVTLTDQAFGSECKTSFASEPLKPGCAGVLNFSDRGETSGAVQLQLGDVYLAVWAQSPMMGVPSVFLKFNKERRLTTLGRWSDRQGGACCSPGSPYTAHLRLDDPSADCTVHLLLGKTEDLMTARRSVSSHRSSGQGTQANVGGPLAVEFMDSSQLLSFANWCCDNDRTALVGALFFMEYAAVFDGLAGLAHADRAFMLNLLICGFIVNGALYLNSFVSQTLLEGDVQRWRAKEPEMLRQGRLSQYEAYKNLGLEDSALQDYIETALVLLKSAALQCAWALGKAVATWVAAGEPKHLRRPSERPSSACSKPGNEENSKIMFQHLKSKTMQMDEKQLSKDQQKSERLLTTLVRECIDVFADFTMSSERLFQAVESALSDADARKALRRYRTWVPAARRRFTMSSMSSAEVSKVIGLSSKKCSGCSCLRIPQDPEVRFYSMGGEVFAGLDRGAVTSPEQVQSSLGRESARYWTMSTNSKSGEFFFFSGDRRFIIKTISVEEGKLLHSMLPGYQGHIQMKSRSLIVRYAGLVCLEVAGSQQKWFSIMANVFNPLFPIHETFDVKGSTFKRKMKEGEKIGKDEDWVNSKTRIVIPEETRLELCAAHEQDADFLLSCGVMDYSMLIGVHKYSGEEKPSRGMGWRNPDDPSSGIWSLDATTLYFVGLIDFLISYSLSKKGEHIIRSVQGHGEDASCVDPLSYARRQVRFVRDQVIEFPNNIDPLGTLGTLHVKVLSAQNLRGADLTGTSDPYVYVSLGLQRLRTHTVPKNCDPDWNSVLRFGVDEAHLESQVMLSIWDQDLGVLRGADDFLGRLTVPVALMREGPVELIDTPLIDVKQGRLSVKLEFVYGREYVYHL